MPDDEWGVHRLDLPAYLDRLGIDDLPTDPVAALTAVHRAHVLTIPFENLDVILGRGVSVDLEDVQAKLVGRRRGGYCYEHGTLFGAVAARLGFRVQRLLARIGPADEPPRARTHLVVVAEEGGRRWFCDVGFGSGLLEPLPLVESSTPVRQGAWSYRLRTTDEAGWELREVADGTERGLHHLTLEVVHPADVVVANHYTSTWPHSPFVAGPVVVRKGDDEVRRLLGRRLSVDRPGRPTDGRTVGADAYAATLADLGVVLGDADADRLVTLLV